MSIRGIGETGVQIGQTIGPLLSGLAFDLNGSYVISFVTFAILAAVGSVIVGMSKPPQNKALE